MQVQEELLTPNPLTSAKPALNNKRVGSKGMKIINSAILAVATGIAVFFFVTGGYIWVFVFVACVFLLSGKDAINWILLLVAALFISVGFHSLGYLKLSYSPETIFNFFLSLL
ncbi:MAG: hypothetical protein LUQ65_02680, partial [Candidatus Helarchaeota archaeon]|nr:hypothetical protein [Candidatus Helarchaeota archaeon]